MGWWPSRSSRDRELSVCGGNFPQHAVRHRRNTGRFSFTRGQHFLCRFSPVAAVDRHGIFAPARMSGGTLIWFSHFWTTEHGECGVLRHPRRPRRCFRDPHFWPLSASADRWRITSSRYRPLGCKTWPCNFLWRAHHRGGISCADSEWIAGFLAARCADRDRHLLCRSFYVHDFVSVHSRTAASAASRLGLRDGKKICAIERAAPCPRVDFCQRGSRIADRNRVFTCSAAPLRGEHTFTGTEEQSCQSRASRDHPQNSNPLAAV